jgi:hypothetical protein
MCGHNWQAGTENKPQSYQYKNLEGGGLDVAYEGTHNSMMNIGRTDDRVERKESCGELLDTCLSLRLLFGSPCSYGFRPYKPQSEQTADSQSTLSSLEAQSGLPYFWWALSRLLCCHGGASGFLLKSHTPYRPLGGGMACLSLAALACRVLSPSPSTLSFRLPLPQPHNLHGKKEAYRRVTRVEVKSIM